MNWKPVEKHELERIIDSQCKCLSAQEIEFFEKIKVPFEKVNIEREDGIEEVFIVAKFGNAVIFYEDIEGGFEVSKPNNQGIIAEYGTNQFTIQHIINQLRASDSSHS